MSTSGIPSARKKLARANVHLAELRSAVDDFRTNSSYEVAAGTTGHLRTPTSGPAEHGGDMDLGLAERTALVCASTSGLGLATARALCEDGARVVVTSRSSERAEEVAAALPSAIGIGCDLVAADGAARLFGESTKRVGKIDILVLNGPGPAPGTAADVDDAGVDSAVAALVKPQVQLVRSVLPAMQAQRWGRILSISSTSILAPIANLALSNLGRAAQSVACSSWG